MRNNAELNLLNLEINRTNCKLNILKLNSTIKYLKKIRPKYLIHLAGLSRPIDLHENNLKKSISLNIIGTSNITNV